MGLLERLVVSVDPAPGQDPTEAIREYFEEANKPLERRVAAVLGAMEPVLRDCASRLKLIPVEGSEVSQRTVLRPSTGEDRVVEATFVVASAAPLADQDRAWLQGQVEALLTAPLP